MPESTSACGFTWQLTIPASSGLLSKHGTKKADFVKKYLHTGRLVYVEGQLVNVSWRTKEGNTRNEIRIRLTHILFLDAPDPNVAGPSADEEEDPFLTEEDEFAFSDED